jgi:hypothetical protein
MLMEFLFLDYLGSPHFSPSMRELIIPAQMDIVGKQEATLVLDGMQTEGQTSMWLGIEAGLDVLRTHPSQHTKALWVFTDGIPTLVPPRGHQGMLQRYEKTYGGLPGNLSTFGFGYQLDSALLEDLAQLGNGTYSFIPDVGMVGTVFVHAIANLIACSAGSCQVTVEGDISDAWISTAPAGKKTVRKPGQQKLVADLGQVNMGQTRDFVIKVENPALCSVTARIGGQDVQGCLLPPDPDRCVAQLARIEAVRGIALARSNANFSLDKALQAVLEVVGKLREMREESDSPVIADILSDLEGQVAMGLSRQDYYQRWGAHYFPSIQRAHSLQICTNFKDHGVQHYGGDIFKEVRDEADDQFNQLPPPIPTVGSPTSSPARRSSGPSSYRPAPTNAAPAFSMSLFNTASGACFASGLVLLATGDSKDISDVERGDVLWTDSGPRVVDCVVITTERAVDLVDLGSALVTHWHPVRKAGDGWSFPAELEYPRVRKWAAVYSLLLEGGASFRIGDWEAVALGHGLAGAIVDHAFFARRNVVEEALLEHPGRATGRVFIGGVTRGDDGRVCGFLPPFRSDAL